MYFKDYDVRYSETGENFNATLPSIMSYFQDTSIEHSENSENGAKKLAKKNIAWLLTGWHVRIFRYPTLFEKLKASTWATDFKHVYGYRNFSLTDECGQTVAVAASVWVLYNREKLKFQKVTENEAQSFGIDKTAVFDDDKTYRLKTLSNYTHLCSVTASKNDIDSNGHVNNVSYITYIVNALPDTEIFDLRIQYKSQARLGDKINISYAREDDITYILMTSDNGTIYTIAQIEKI